MIIAIITIGICNINDLSCKVLIVTFDMIVLYPSIPLKLSRHVLSDILFVRNLPTKEVNGILNITELVCKKNVFEFNSEYLLKTSGTAIGNQMPTSLCQYLNMIYQPVHVTNL